jgi:hypothetical protein
VSKHVSQETDNSILFSFILIFIVILFAQQIVDFLTLEVCVCVCVNKFLSSVCMV